MIAKAIADYLVTEGLGTFATDIFVSSLPPTPDDCIAVIETNGDAPEVDIPLYNPTFQVLIRNSSYATGSEKLAAVRDALHRVANITQNDIYFYYILANTNGGSIGKDGNGRDEFSINFRCKTREAV